MRNKIVIFLLVIIASIFFLGFTKDYYFKVNKSFDVFGAIFREVSANYVLEIDPEILMRGAIKGMLSTLDPYTEFYDIEDEEDFNILTEGTYTGFGISISNIDSMLTITQIKDGYAARKAGLRIGDRICYVDGVNVLYLDYNDVKGVLKGPNGSTSNIRILRDGNPDTLDFTLERKQILLDNIGYYDLIDSSTAYIKVEHFNQTAAQDFRFALNELRRRSKLESLIIDLRDNPGGLLEPAVQICEAFLPYGSTIVTTRGRNDEELYSFKSTSNPIEPDLPLVVLINENSASASEIIAGALQDYDRALIVGKRSYGKGLVQSILQLPYQGNLKLTTAKYYTPSGRCIQRIKFAEKYQESSKVTDSPDSTVYYTTNGRKVYESTGIKPDTTTIKENYSELIADLYSKFQFFKFANQYTSRLPSLSKDFKVDDKIFSEFTKYIKDGGYIYKSEADLLLERFSVISKESKYSESFDKNLKALIKSVEKEDQALFDRNKAEIIEYLDFEIKSRFLTEREIITNFMPKDNDMELALNLLKSKGTYSMLLQKK